jgi:shikimate kinase
MILKLKRTPGLYIVGFMGCGKSTVGRIVARQLGWRFADIDTDIEHAQQMSINDIFDRHGEEEFRRIEAAALERRVHDVARGIPWVIAVGGGCFLQPQNLDLIQNHGISMWLDCPLEVIRERIAHSTHRPLARDPHKLAELYEARRAGYERADYRIVVETNDSQAAAEEILRLPIY